MGGSVQHSQSPIKAKGGAVMNGSRFPFRPGVDRKMEGQCLKYGRHYSPMLNRAEITAFPERVGSNTGRSDHDVRFFASIEPLASATLYVADQLTKRPRDFVRAVSALCGVSLLRRRERMERADNLALTIWLWQKHATSWQLVF
jgi:hypothetical protein